MLIDSTLREGEQAFGVYFNDKIRRKVAGLLFRIGLDEVEAGYVGQENMDRFLDWARPRAGTTALSLWCPCRSADLRRAVALAPDRLNLGVPASEAHMHKRLGLTRQGLLDRLAEVLHKGRSLGLTYLSVGLEDVSRADPAFALDLAGTAVEMGASRIRLSDTVGLLDPLSTADMVRTFARALPVPVGVHLHNDFGMATANAVAALKAGAAFADVSALGLGERAGIPRLEEVAAWLTLRDEGGRYDLSPLRVLCEVLAKALGRDIPGDKAIVGADVFASESGLHVHGLLKDPSLFEPFDPEAVGGQRRLAVGAKSGSSAVAQALARLGLGRGRRADENLVAEARRISRQAARPLRPEELRALAWRFSGDDGQTCPS